MTSNNGTLSRQNLLAGNIAKSRKVWESENVDRRPLLQRGVMNFQLYNKLLTDWSQGKQLILFPEAGLFPSELVIKCYYQTGIHHPSHDVPRGHGLSRNGRPDRSAYDIT